MSEYLHFEQQRRLQDAEHQRLARRARRTAPAPASRRAGFRHLLRRVAGSNARPAAVPAGVTSPAPESPAVLPHPRTPSATEEIQRYLALTAGRH
jgi:hypothetical protein